MWVIKGGKRSLPDTHGNTQPLQYWGRSGGWTYSPTLAQEYESPEAALRAGTDPAAPRLYTAAEQGVEIVTSPIRDHGHPGEAAS